MNIFLSYKFTGENPHELFADLSKITETLKNAGHNIFCSFFLEDFFQKQKWTISEIYEYCLQEQKKCDCYLAFIKSASSSVGMEKELCQAEKIGQECVLAIQKQFDFPRFRKQAKLIFEFDALEDLCEQLKLIRA